MANMSIRTKILVSVGLIIFMVLGASTYIYIRLLEQDYLESIGWVSETLAQILVKEIIDIYKYVPNIQSLLEGVTSRCMDLYETNKEKKVSHIAVINTSGIIAAHSNSESLGKSIDSPFLREQLQRQEQVMILDDDVYRALVPVFGTQENVYIGTVDVGFPKQVVDEKIKQVIIQAAKLFLIFVALAFFVISILVHVLVTKPIRFLVKIGEKVAKGEIEDILTVEIEQEIQQTKTTRDEIHVLTTAFYGMIGYLQEKADIANHISVGDIRQEITSRSEGDILGNAFQRMTDYLHEMTTVATIIAVGELRQHIQMKSQHDMLGNSFQEMITFIQHVADVAEKISEGDLRVNVTPRSEMDILNHSLQKMVTYIQDVANVAGEIANNNNLHVSVTPRSEHDILNRSLQQMLTNLQAANEKVGHSMAAVEGQNWFRTGQVELNDLIRGEQDTTVLAKNVITYIAKYLQAQIGVFYLADVRNGKPVLQLAGSYAYSPGKGHVGEYMLGEGVIGQAALDRKVLLIDDIPEDHMSIMLGLGENTPRHLLVIPLIYEGEVRGVIELGTAYEFTDQHQEFLAQMQEKIAITIHSTQARIKMQQLLSETQQQAEILQRQEEELRQANQELEEQTHALKISEEKLQMQQEELQQTNEALEGQAQTLEIQKIELQEKNIALEKARRLVEENAQDLEQSKQLLEEKMRELEVSERYKSEFLANMSHELRNPLNSLLILAEILYENKEGNLIEKQLGHVRTIHEAGTELLKLLNEVLDLSKVETGKMILNIENMDVSDLAAYITQHFVHVAEAKGLSLKIRMADDVPPSIHTDRQRVEQIMKNLLSNALKFAEQGEVRVYIHRPIVTTNFLWSQLAPHQTIAIAVSDTGIGIPENKQQVIFEAFQQLDGTISRKYGGTGLGLSISRELARLLGGEIHVHSEAGKGSTFTLYLPEAFNQGLTGKTLQVQRKESGVVEELQEMNSLPLASSSSKIDHIRDDRREIGPSDKSLLIIENDPTFAKALFALVRDRGFKGLIAGDGEAGLHLAYQYKPDAIILDTSLPRMDGHTVMEKLRKNPDICRVPIHSLAYHEDALKQKEKKHVDQNSEQMTMSAEVSLERMQDEVQLFLHKVETELSVTQQKKVRIVHDKKSILREKTILLVDDDTRNSYALMSVLEEYEVQVILAENGKEALTMLEEHREIHLVLMDIMMPVMDGYEAIQAIRKQSRFQQLPIIAFTAKAMRGERQKCIEAGANDYLSKPVEIDKLLSLLRVWLY